MCGPPAGGVYLEFVRVPEGKVVKNRVHLGCSVPTITDLDPEIARLVALGATIGWEEDFPPAVAASYRNVVLRDVEGNEFCLGGGSLRLNRFSWLVVRATSATAARRRAR